MTRRNARPTVCSRHDAPSSLPFLSSETVPTMTDTRLAEAMSHSLTSKKAAGTSLSLNPPQRCAALVDRAHRYVQRVFQGSTGTDVPSSTMPTNAGTRRSGNKYRTTDTYHSNAGHVSSPSTTALHSWMAIGDHNSHDRVHRVVASVSHGPLSTSLPSAPRTSESWQSDLLRYETELHEIAACGYDCPPLLSRTARVFAVYDGMCRVAEQHSSMLAELLRLCRAEFCHAIFCGGGGGGGDGGSAVGADVPDMNRCADGSRTTQQRPEGTLRTNRAPTSPHGTPLSPSLAHGRGVCIRSDDVEMGVHAYFDAVSQLRRHNALLIEESAHGCNAEAVGKLYRQLQHSEENARLYENEIGRLTRQHVASMNQCQQAVETLHAQEKAAAAQQIAAECAIQSLRTDNKEMKLELFRMRKHVEERQTKLVRDRYRSLKQNRMSIMTQLFDEGDERVCLLVLLGQLETQLNEVLDRYDAALVMHPAAELADVRRRMGYDVCAILEEMHLCEASYRRLVHAQAVFATLHTKHVRQQPSPQQQPEQQKQQRIESGGSAPGEMSHRHRSGTRHRGRSTCDAATASANSARPATLSPPRSASTRALNSRVIHPAAAAASPSRPNSSASSAAPTRVATASHPPSATAVAVAQQAIAKEGSADETDGFAAVLFDPLAYRALRARVTAAMDDGRAGWRRQWGVLAAPAEQTARRTNCEATQPPTGSSSSSSRRLQTVSGARTTEDPRRDAPAPQRDGHDTTRGPMAEGRTMDADDPCATAAIATHACADAPEDDRPALRLGATPAATRSVRQVDAEAWDKFTGGAGRPHGDESAMPPTCDGGPQPVQRTNTNANNNNNTTNRNNHSRSDCGAANGPGQMGEDGWSAAVSPATPAATSETAMGGGTDDNTTVCHPGRDGVVGEARVEASVSASCSASAVSCDARAHTTSRHATTPSPATPRRSLEQLVRHRCHRWVRRIFAPCGAVDERGDETDTTSSRSGSDADANHHHHHRHHSPSHASKQSWVERCHDRLRVAAPLPPSSSPRGAASQSRHAPPPCADVTATVAHPLGVDAMLPRLLVYPFVDMTGSQFNRGIELYGGTDGMTQKYMGSVHYVDPSMPIELPDAVNVLRIKFNNSLADGAGGTGGGLTASRAAQRTQSMTTTQTMWEWVPESRLSLLFAGGVGDGADGGLMWPHAAHDAAHMHNEAERSLAPPRRQRHPPREGRARTGDGVGTGEGVWGVFEALGQPARMLGSCGVQAMTSAMSSTLATTLTLQRLNPQLPNRSPEWSLYQALFGGYRSLTPRLLDRTTLDHVLMNACGRYFAKMESRFMRICEFAAPSSAIWLSATATHGVGKTNTSGSNGRRAKEGFLRALGGGGGGGGGSSGTLPPQVERRFREGYELTDFQDALVEELEARYGFAELVAKTLYEMLCYLDAMSDRAPVLNLYLEVIRGFVPATQIHYMCTMLYTLSAAWPCASATQSISRDDAMIVLSYLYDRVEAVLHVDINGVMKDFDMATRTGCITLNSMRDFFASALFHHEEPMLLYFHGLFSNHCKCENLNEVSLTSYRKVIAKFYHEGDEMRSVARFLTTGLGINRAALLSVKDLAYVASSSWCSQLWH